MESKKTGEKHFWINSRWFKSHTILKSFAGSQNLKGNFNQVKIISSHIRLFPTETIVDPGVFLEYLYPIKIES